MKRIPGTRVPDHAIHRASLWLEDLKYGEGREDAKLQRMDDFTWRAFIEECDLPVTVEQLQEAATYYGMNMLGMTLGNRVNVRIPAPDGDGFIDLHAIFASLWLDAFMHGAATAIGKSGLSNDEMRRR